MKSFFFLIVGLLFALALPAHYASFGTVAFAATLIVLAYFMPVKVRTNAHTAGTVTQHGLQKAFERARNSIYVGNLPGGTEIGASPDQIKFARAESANAVLSQSNLRLVQIITANLNSFLFPVQVDQPTTNVTEIRLQKQDAFFCSNIAFYLAKAASAVDVSYKTQTYPDPVNWATGALVNGLYTIYNGSMKITINKSVIVPNYPMLNFLQIPQTQNIAAIVGQQNQFDPSQVSIWEPTINFIGTKQNVFELNLPASMTATIEATTLGIFELQGVLAQNCTSFT